MIKLSEDNKIETHENTRVADAPANIGVGTIFIASTAILPGNPLQPCPELLTEAEAIRYLRLDGDPNAARTLRYYRDKGVLYGTQVGRHLLYRRVELERFLEQQTEDINSRPNVSLVTRQHRKAG